jgi:hypothetical protein
MVAVTVVVCKTVPAPLEKTWPLWADFTRFHVEICGHPAAECTNSGSSEVGATREMTSFGGLLKETLISIDPPNSFSYDMGPFGPLELDSYNATYSFEKDGEGTKVTVKGVMNWIGPDTPGMPAEGQAPWATREGMIALWNAEYPRWIEKGGEIANSD